jgi:hypothetical protein
VSLSSMNVQNAGEDGIFGTTVTGLDLNGCSITGSGDDSEDVGIRVNNVLGSATWTNLTVTGSELANVFIDNTTGTLNSWTISGGTFSNLGTAFGGNSILANIRGTATLTTGSITGATFANNKPAVASPSRRKTRQRSLVSRCKRAPLRTTGCRRASSSPARPT